MKILWPVDSDDEI